MIDKIYESYHAYTVDIIIEIDLDLTAAIIEQRQCKDIDLNYIHDYIDNKFESIVNHDFNCCTKFNASNELFLIVSKNLYLIKHTTSRIVYFMEIACYF